MVLRLKTRESRSLPGLLKAINPGFCNAKYRKVLATQNTNLLNTILGPSRLRAALKAALLLGTILKWRGVEQPGSSSGS